MLTTKHKSRAKTQNIKKRRLRKKLQQTNLLKWQTKTQGKKNNGDTEQSENKR